VFQLKARACATSCARPPQRLDDLIALNALYRPGPLRSGMVDDFIARKQAREIAQSCRSLANPEDTYGVIATGAGHACRRDARELHAGAVRRCARRWARRTRPSWRRSARRS
jgi:hypothetical protein